MKYMRLLIVTLALAFSATEAFAQCAAMFNQGQKYMKSGKYELAITQFKKAMECDPELTDKCKQSIQQCNAAMRKLKKSKADDESEAVSKLEMSVYDVDFEYKGGSKLVSVESEPAVWQVDGAVPEWIVAKANPEGKELVLNAEANSATEPREGTITVKNAIGLTKTVKLTQSGSPQTLAASCDVMYYNKERKYIGYDDRGLRQIVTDKKLYADYGEIKFSGSAASTFVVDDKSCPAWVELRRADNALLVKVALPEKGKSSVPCRVYTFIISTPDGGVHIPITICQFI